MENSRINFTLVTGYLGAGKTSLLRHLLTEHHGYELAFIINEFGEIGIDGALVLEDNAGRMLEMNNGCVCCEVRDDLITAINDLFARREDGTIHFNHIIMETTGLARPGPIVETLRSPVLKQLISLNGIITVVDVFHIASQLDDSPEVQEQIGAADLIMLNKADLVETKQLHLLEKRISAMNAQAKLLTTRECKINANDVFDVAKASFALFDDASFTVLAKKTPSNSIMIGDADRNRHLDNISSLSIEIKQPLQQELLLDWFSFFIMRYEERLLRFKGILNFKDHDQRVLFQGVHSLFDTTRDREWKEGEKRVTRIVFIGRDLPEDEIRSGINACIAE